MAQLTFSTSIEVIDALKVLADGEKRSISNFVHVLLTSNPKVKKEMRKQRQALEERRKEIGNKTLKKLNKRKSNEAKNNS